MKTLTYRSRIRMLIADGRERSSFDRCLQGSENDCARSTQGMNIQEDNRHEEAYDVRFIIKSP